MIQSCFSVPFGKERELNEVELLHVRFSDKSQGTLTASQTVVKEIHQVSLDTQGNDEEKGGNHKGSQSQTFDSLFKRDYTQSQKYANRIKRKH